MIYFISVKFLLRGKIQTDVPIDLLIDRLRICNEFEYSKRKREIHSRIASILRLISFSKTVLSHDYQWSNSKCNNLPSFYMCSIDCMSIIIKSLMTKKKLRKRKKGNLCLDMYILCQQEEEKGKEKTYVI